MRLIDADKLIEILSKNSIFRTVTNAEDKSVIEIIEQQPTAFDVDKVVEQLEELKNIHYVRFDRYMKQGQKDLGKKHLIKFNAYNKAIDVVKAGGIIE